MSSAFHFNPNLPPEIQEEIKKQMDRQMMYHDSVRHDIDRLFDELTKDQLVTLRVIFNSINQEQASVPLAAYYEGVISQTLRLKFDVCGGCGQDHTEQMIEKTEETLTQPTIITPTLIQPSLFEDQDEMTVRNEHDDGELDDTDKAIMDKYNLDDVRDEDTFVLLGFICKKCGMRYPSIGERTMRGPDDCMGCQQKTKWG